MPYLAMLASFLVLVYLERDAPADPTNSMTVVIFVLTLLIMLRQGVLSRDDALLRERRAVGIVEARYASLIKNASDVIMIVDVDGRLRLRRRRRNGPSAVTRTTWWVVTCLTSGATPAANA